MKKNLEICSLKELKENGKMVAFVKGNRSLNTKNLSSKEESLQKYGMNLIPLMYIQGTKAVADGLKIVEPNSDTEIQETDAKDYIVIIDGQHRYTAALDSEIKEENIYLFESYADFDTKDLLATTNIDAYSWDSKDFAGGATLFNEGNEFLEFVNDLASKGYSISTIGLILYFKPNKLSKKSLSLMMTGKEPVSGYNLERAKLFIESAKKAGFEDSFIAKRYLIDVIIDLASSNKDNIELCKSICVNKLAKITKDSRDKILKAKTFQKEDAIKTAILSV